MLTVVSEAVARYLAEHNERTQEQYLRIMCPVNVRTESKAGALGNQVSAIFPMLPAWPMTPATRHGVVCAEVERIKQEQEAQALTLLQTSMPEAVAGRRRRDAARRHAVRSDRGRPRGSNCRCCRRSGAGGRRTSV